MTPPEMPQPGVTQYRLEMLRSGRRAQRPPIADLVIAGVFLVIGQVVTWAWLEAPAAPPP